MCLTKVYPPDHPLPASKIGFKIFSRNQGSRVPQWYRLPWKQHFKGVNEWNVDEAQGEILATDGNRYPTGFHIYTHRADAERFTWAPDELAMVEFDDVVAIGAEGVFDREVIVAKRFKFLE